MNSKLVLLLQHQTKCFKEDLYIFNLNPTRFKLAFLLSWINKILVKYWDWYIWLTLILKWGTKRKKKLSSSLFFQEQVDEHLAGLNVMQYFVTPLWIMWSNPTGWVPFYPSRFDKRENQSSTMTELINSGTSLQNKMSQYIVCWY